MSRSHHANRKLIAREARFSYSDRSLKRERLDELWADLEAKRAAKRNEGARHRTAAAEAPWVDPDTIPIVVLDQSEFVHHPASSDDLRAFMRQLPAGYLSGIREIRLELGTQECAQEAREWGEEYGEECHGLTADPFVGRVSKEGPADVWEPVVYGLYFENDVIHLHAYVYAPDLPDRPMWELYLRALVLTSFVHEIGHFRDSWSRRHRRGWQDHEHDRDEEVAERFAALWCTEHLQRFLVGRYPAECEALRLWLRWNAGCEVPLHFVHGAARPGPGGRIGLSPRGNMREAIGDLSRAVGDGAPDRERRAEFAEAIHILGFEAMAIPLHERLLEEQPDDLEQLEQLACALEDVGRNAEAIERCHELLARTPETTRCWPTLLRALGNSGRFAELFDAADSAVRLAEGRGEKAVASLGWRAHALAGLARLDEAERDLDTILDRVKAKDAPGRAPVRPPGLLLRRELAANEGLRAYIHLRRGNLEALRKLRVASGTGGDTYAESLKRAAKFEAMHALGRPDLAPRLSRRCLQLLRDCGWAEWASKLEALLESARWPAD